MEIEEATWPNQAFLYRINGDKNPLHVDPDVAKDAGFDKPILHGMCTYGMITKTVYKEICKRLFPESKTFPVKSIRARFTSHVFPGETLVERFWKTDEGVIFEVRTKERGDAVVVGEAEFYHENSDHPHLHIHDSGDGSKLGSMLFEQVRTKAPKS